MWRRMVDWARAIRRDVHALWLAGRDPRVPWYAKAFALLIAAYALSPIDLIPDFIPVVGYLDDVVLVAIVVDGLLNHVDRRIVLEHWPGNAASLERTAAVAAQRSAGGLTGQGTLRGGRLVQARGHAQPVPHPAADLHDEVGGLLTRVTMQAELLRAAREYAEEVRTGAFPGPEHSFT